MAECSSFIRTGKYSIALYMCFFYLSRACGHLGLFTYSGYYNKCYNKHVGVVSVRVPNLNIFEYSDDPLLIMVQLNNLF